MSKNLVIVPYCLETGRLFGEERRETCFVSIHASAEQREIYDHAIQPTVEEAGFRCVRLDEASDASAITERVIEYIRNSFCVIADLTDMNPTVVYQVGVAHALQKPVILLSQHQSHPFEVSMHRHIRYERQFRGVEPLRKSLRDALRELHAARR